MESLCVSFLVCGKEGRLWKRRYRLGKKGVFGKDVIAGYELCITEEELPDETELPDGTELPDKNGQRGETCLQSVWGSVIFRAI